MKTWEIYAIRHATNDTRTRGVNFISDPDPMKPLVLDFFCWVLRCGREVIVVDTGIDPETGAKNGHRQIMPPPEGWTALGIDPAQVTTVLLTHAHYDHLGYLDALPKARFYMQAEEMAYVTGPWMEKPTFRHAYKADEIARLVHLLHDGRLHLHGREFDVADGISAHWVGGHCAGQEVLRIRTQRGWVVLASDALHYYEEFERGIPFTVAFNISDMMAAHDRIRELADSDNHVLPAHDPRLLNHYPAISPEMEGRILRLDPVPEIGA
ncbi:Glyoxylase, beta-lactamase superfamily II [Paracoccus isoporae]|uniref:Glyoxylase, beta-lactamase superfamily II n=1 Tax=Paracoccus isoporae TaxID=591205 RepID=A0A1G7CP71_9RHOB|nr:N-acyl homoserine lactonase family protein [Paracoccus isoporae]SDE41013.1 Glyoxylase, beta-lactamase superfamily II [Paracoccus isoporae]